MRTTYFVSEEGLARLLESLDAPHVYAAIRRRGSPQFADLRAVPEADLALRDARPSASPKAFLQPARERVAAYSVAGEGGAGPEPLAETCGACEARRNRLLVRPGRSASHPHRLACGPRCGGVFVVQVVS